MEIKVTPSHTVISNGSYILHSGKVEDCGICKSRSEPSFIEDVKELLDRFIESGMAEEEDGELLDRLHQRLQSK